MKKIKVTESQLRAIKEQNLFQDEMSPITPEAVKQQIMEELNNWEVDNPNMEQAVNDLVGEIMDNLWSTVYYLSENYESDLEQIALGDNYPTNI